MSQSTVKGLKEKLKNKNTHVVAVYTNGLTIKVLGIFDNSEAGQSALKQLEEEMDVWEEELPGSVNFVVSDPLISNIVQTNTFQLNTT